MKKLFAIASVLSALLCVEASPIRSNIGAKGMQDEGKAASYTAADYIQDGLIAMWDGIENAGYGLHTDDPTVWIDLSGNDNNFIVATQVADSPGVFEKDHLDISLQTKYKTLHGSVLPGQFTIECMTIGYRNGATAYNIKLSNFQNNALIIQGCQYWDKKVYTYTSYIFQNATSTISFPSTIAQAAINPIHISMRNGQDGLFLARYMGQSSAISFPNNTFWANSQYKGNPIFLNVNGTDCTSKIYFIRIYNRPLTDEEIEYNYSIDKVRFNLP